MASEERDLTRALARVNAISLGVTIGSLLAIGLFVATLALVVQGGPPSRHLSLLSQYFPGYRVSTGGAFVGALWAGVLGFAASALAALPYYRGLIARVQEAPGASDDVHLGVGVDRLPVREFSIAVGILCGITILAADYLLLISHSPGKPLGPHLRLLHQLLPGFQVSWIGGLIGFAYLFPIGALVAACVASIYNRIVSSSEKRGKSD